MGGGNMLRAAGRAVGAGIGPGAVSMVKPNPNNFLSVPSSSVTLPVSVTSTVSSHRTATGRFVDDWGDVQELEDDGFRGVSGFSPRRHVFGAVPSREEVESALSKLQESQLNWGEPALHLHNPKAAQSQAYDHIFDAFHLLQTSPSVQRMVVSLSSDKAVWNAVMNNEAVKELRESFYTAESRQLESSKEDSQLISQFLRWILDSAKGKIAEIIDKITKLMNDLFRPSEQERTTDIFEDTLRSSLMLSVMVLLVVVVTRVQRA